MANGLTPPLKAGTDQGICRAAEGSLGAGQPAPESQTSHESQPALSPQQDLCLCPLSPGKLLTHTSGAEGGTALAQQQAPGTASGGFSGNRWSGGPR